MRRFFAALFLAVNAGLSSFWFRSPPGKTHFHSFILARMIVRAIGRPAVRRLLCEKACMCIACDKKLMQYEFVASRYTQKQTDFCSSS